ncbi:MAG: type II toxin-antitoxin system Phd/YefM family antitoxin [Dehalococcoidia bacterium]
MRVDIETLREHLAEYLERSNQGEWFTICDGDEPVAQLRPVQRRLAMRPAVVPWSEVANIKPVQTKHPIDVVALLSEDRDGR